MVDLIDAYLEYTADTEPPRIYYRWSLITGVSALLGRGIFVQHGNSRIFPNLYCMLIGDPGTRKSTAIKATKRLLSAAGYDNFAADKSSKEKFLLDLAGEEDGDLLPVNGKSKTVDKVTERNLWGDGTDTPTEPKEVFIVADEFNEFAGVANLDFYTTLGNMWDWDDVDRPFTQRFKTSKSVSIWQPTVSILGGNTPDNFARAFPPEIIGQGFFSRLLLIHGQRTGRKITFPRVPDVAETKALVEYLQHIRRRYQFGSITISRSGYELFDNIYQGWRDLPDPRFLSYSNRRFMHLLKMTMVITAMDNADIITPELIIEANTILSAAEALMPRALGEFGKARNSDITNRIMELINNANAPITAQQIWAKVGVGNLKDIQELQGMMSGLGQAGKVQYVVGKGYLPKKEVYKPPEYVDWKYLTEEERLAI